MCLLLLMVGVVLVAALLLTGSAGASGHSATRSFASPSVAPGGQIEVTITAQNYGAFALAVETLPGGFTYIGSSLPDAAVDARLDAVTFTLLGEEQFTYTVQAPAVEAEFTFSGVVRDQHKVEHEVGGDTGLRVGPPLTPAPTPDPQASPTAGPTPTATPVPTPTPTATPPPDCDAASDSDSHATRANSNTCAGAHGNAWRLSPPPRLRPDLRPLRR